MSYSDESDSECGDDIIVYDCSSDFMYNQYVMLYETFRTRYFEFLLYMYEEIKKEWEGSYFLCNIELERFIQFCFESSYLSIDEN